ncbi:dihydroxyacetone kinase [Microbacterium sp. CH12i]|uniref:dihydroxyacetone kinase subunit DhaL n=1 Tax=Microbacterium sp. CH12i TaxID=1479651 RepID=UPI0004610949|nr:dihydroxyacetone kinase subunit DhaL [Microbacterium sp. CH12i]KDA05314.1 dihydroxyacetone kinase [Microbacterium sp. CH12i]
MTAVAAQSVRFIVESIARTAVDNEQEFGDLDAVVGDGDFGFSLARGFEKVLEDIDAYPTDDPGSFLQGVAMTISSRIGGTSGPIWGTAFLRAAMVAKGRDALTAQDAVEMLRASVAGIQARGKAELGDKTLLDALVPAIDELERAAADGGRSSEIIDRIAVATRSAAEATSSLQAMRGRASYSGARSIGSPDAGAIALAVIAERLALEWPKSPAVSE